MTTTRHPMPVVSILVPTYNCAHFLPEALDSILSQTFVDYEAIIIDDGSTDNTHELVQGYVSRYPGKFRYFRESNKGVTVARNKGIRNAHGVFLALLDADDSWLPERLQEGVKAITADPKIGLVHGNIIRVSETGENLGEAVREKRYLSGDIFDYIFLRKAHISCPTALFRKSCCERVGLFDENLAHLGCEDRELWLRIAREFKVQYIDKVLAYYRVRQSSMSHDLDRMMRARRYVIDKHAPEGSGHQRLRKEALAQIYRDLGDEFLFKKEFNQAQKQYLTAISLHPMSIWPWINYLKAKLRIEVKHVP